MTLAHAPTRQTAQQTAQQPHEPHAAARAARERLALLRLSESDEHERKTHERDAQIVALHASTLTDDDRAAYETLFVQSYHGVVAHVQRLVGQYELACDLATDAFVRVWRHWTQQRAYADAQRRSYVYQIATTVALDELRRRRHAPHVALSLSDQGARTARSTYSGTDDASELAEIVDLSEASSADTQPERVVLALEEWRDVLALCRSDRERVIVNMRAALYTSDEIAYVLRATGIDSNASAPTVRLLFSRFLKRAKKRHADETQRTAQHVEQPTLLRA